MNLSERGAYRWCLTALKLAPLAILLMALYSNAFTIQQFAEFLPNFSFSDSLVQWLTTNMGLTQTLIFDITVGYFNYLVMFHLVECLC